MACSRSRRRRACEIKGSRTASSLYLPNKSYFVLVAQQFILLLYPSCVNPFLLTDLHRVTPPLVVTIASSQAVSRMATTPAIQFDDDAITRARSHDATTSGHDLDHGIVRRFR